MTIKKLVYAGLGRSALTAMSLALVACNGQLEVIDDSEGDPGGGGANEGGNAFGNDCGCASSASLTAITCGFEGGEIRSLPSVPHVTHDGSVIAFSVCFGDTAETECPAMHYRTTTGAKQIGNGFVSGLDGAGHTVLIQGCEGCGGSLLIEVNGGTSGTPITPLFFNALSPDGEIVAGYDASAPSEAFLARWSSAAGLERMSDSLNSTLGGVWDATPDFGLLVGGVGGALDGVASLQPFRATSAGMALGLGALPAGAVGALATSVSSDGSVIAGSTLGLGSVFRWTEASGIVELASLGSDQDAFLSDDGQILAGSFDPPDASVSQAFRWTAEDGVTPLTPGLATIVTQMSADGSVIVGATLEHETTPEGEEVELYGAPFMWDEGNGARVLATALEASGVDTSGWEFGSDLQALSTNGQVLVGVGTCGGKPALYRMVLPD